MDNKDFPQKVRNLNHRINHVTKEREDDGSWRYKVVGKEGVILAEMVFTTGREYTNRLTNSDLLEIVRDRLFALNRGRSASDRSRSCYQHVCEALLWADMTDSRMPTDEDNDDNITNTEE